LGRTFGDWRAPATPTPTRRDLSIPAREELQVVLVDRPDAVQNVIRFTMPGPRYGDEKRVRYRLVNTLLGGSFTSRLNMNLREEHGYTYGAGSAFVMQPELGYVVASSSVQAEVTGEAVKEFLHEINRIRGGDISTEEAAKARETLRTDVIQSFAGLSGVLSEAAERLVGGLPFESLGDDMAAAQSATAEELNALAGPALPLENGVLVLVGDRKTVLAEIKDLLPTPIEVTIHGKPVEPD
jgi:zinc protease